LAFSLVGSREHRKLSEADLRAAIERAVGCAFDFDIVSIMPWTRRELIADRYGTSRVFLVGDSAHQLSPTGGFGMNTGIQEAVDLAWKLAARLAGWGGDALLASYEPERRRSRRATSRRRPQPRPHVVDAREPSATGNFPARPRRRRGAACIRGEIHRHMRREWFTLGIQLGYRYQNSPICIPDGTPAPPDETATYTQTARPGHRAPHVWLAPGQSTLDLFGRGFVLMRFGTAPIDAAPLATAAAERQVPLTVHDIRDEQAAALYERRLVLVRPDGHVAWRGNEVPADAARLIDTVRGQV